jgi:RNA 2',3'-cyclic 3'-phosphodiesterase
MRAFLAFDLDDATLDAAADLGASLAERVRARWVKRAVMHVTLVFLGEIDGALVPALSEVVRAVREPAGLSGTSPAIRATKLGAFPDERRARVLVVPLEDDGTLARIAKAVEDRTAALGIAREDRAYHPHLTLARFKEPADVRKLAAETKLDIAGHAIALTLYESVLGKNGPTYTPLARAELAR